MLNRDRIVFAFRQALEESARDASSEPLSPRAISRRAHALYIRTSKPGDKRSSPETFRKFAAGRLALPEVVQLLNAAEVRASSYVRADRHHLKAAFQKAVQELAPDLLQGKARPLHVARLAHRLYVQENGETAAPTAHTFERLLYGRAADPEIVALIEAYLKRLDLRQVLDSFRLAVRHLSSENKNGLLRPRAVAMRAHALYAASRKEGDRNVSAETFRKFAVGDRALPEVVALLESSGIRPAARAVIDRERLRAVFQEAIQRLETRIFKGRARPLQIARRAHELYSREEASPPSRHTFQRMVYGKVGDPEILSLIETALATKGKD